VSSRAPALVLLAALAATFLPAGTVHAQQPPPGFCEALVEQGRQNLNDEFSEYMQSSRRTESTFRAHARQARRTRSRPFLNRAYRTAKRVERREALAGALGLGSEHERYRQAATDSGCDPNALVGRHGSLVTQVGANHLRRLRRLRNIYRRAARALA
jgi:hypothetical protein